MAITNKRIVTGTAGAGNVGTGADVTWPTTGNPSLANSGIYYTGAEGAGYVNITTAANRGDFLPWDTTNPKPAWATGSSFVRTPAAATGQIFVAMNNADCVALNSVAPSGGDAAAIDFENGILFTVGFRWYTDPATFSYLAGSLSPAHNPGALSMHEFQINGGTSLYQLRTNPYNVGGFKPSVLFSNGVYSPGVSTILDGKGGFSSAQPNAHIEFNEWHLLQVHVRRSTTDVANDGRIRVYIDGQLVMETTGADVWSTDGSRHGMFLGLLSGYSAARTGMRLDYCAPIKVQIVPESDLPTAIIQDWSANTTRGMALRRLWPAAFVNAPLAISTSDGGTLPTAGRTINISGSFPGRKEFIYRGNAKNFQTLTPNIWDGSAASTPFGAAGWTHVGFMSATPNKGVQTFRVMHPDLSQVLCAVEIDDGVGKTIKINGTTVMSTVSEVPNDTRFQVIVSLKGGQAVVTIHNLSTDSKNSQMVRTFAVSSIYVAGNAIGPAKINSTCAATANAWVAHGAVGVWSKFCVVSGDSFSSSAILEQYAVSGVVTGTKTITVATMGTRIPTAGDKLFWTGSAGAVNDGVYTVASATATTIVTVEVIPNSSATGSIDLVYPRYHTTSQRLGVYIPATGDCDAIPDHYDPCPFGMDALAGFHELLNMARSGGKMSEDIANVLPQCTNIPNPWFIAQCFVVNDTTATVSESAMNTQAISLAAQAKAYAQWVVDRGGKIVLTDAPNSPDAGVVMNGTANRFRRRTMAQVSVHLPRLLADIKASAGSVLYAPIIRRLDSNAVIMTDGLHIDASTGVLLGYELHASLQALKGADGFNTDGSIKAVAASGAGQGVMRSVMGTA